MKRRPATVEDVAHWWYLLASIKEDASDMRDFKKDCAKRILVRESESLQNVNLHALYYETDDFDALNVSTLTDAKEDWQKQFTTKMPSDLETAYHEAIDGSKSALEFSEAVRDFWVAVNKLACLVKKDDDEHAN